MSRACCCSVSHADVISPITTIQYGEDAMELAKRENHHDTVSALTQVVGEGVVSDGMCGGSDGVCRGVFYDRGGERCEC